MRNGPALTERPVAPSMRIDTRENPALSLQQVAEMVTLLSAHSSVVIGSAARFPRDALLRFWSCSQARLKDCHRIIQDYVARARSATPLERHILWEQTDAAACEVLISDMTCRVWSAILIASDRTRGVCDAEPIARHVFLRQMEARQEVLQLMVDGPGVGVDQVLHLDRLRRRLERWVDLMLGHLVVRYDVREFVFDIERSLDFGSEQLQAWNTPQHDRLWQLYLLCVRGGFGERLPPLPLHGRLRTESVRAILACFPSDAFKSEGALKSPWLARLTRDESLREGPPVAGLLHALSSRRGQTAPQPKKPSPK